MHDSALLHGRLFFESYLPHVSCEQKIVDIGAQNVNGSLRQFSPQMAKYIGVDFVAGPGVDVILEDPYHLPFEDNSIDAIVCSSCFEHSEFFWLLFNDILRVLVATGLCYLNMPSNGPFHRYPVDCWRFYPDSGVALEKWGFHSGYNPALLESFLAHPLKDGWRDFVAVFVKESAHANRYPNRIQNQISSFENGKLYGVEGFINSTLGQVKKPSIGHKTRHWLRGKAIGG
jgi:SAM-dependent methyltransferase